MTNQQKLWNFDKWYNCFIKREWFEQSWRREEEWICPTEGELSKECLENFCSIFDYFMCSPNNLYYDDPSGFWFPVGSKSIIYDDLDSAKKNILTIKRSNGYEKLFLYSLRLLKDENQSKWKVRYAAFPTLDHYRFNNACERNEIIRNQKKLKL